MDTHNLSSLGHNVDSRSSYSLYIQIQSNDLETKENFILSFHKKSSLTENIWHYTNASQRSNHI